MHIYLVAASNRQPGWVEEACADYAKRFRGNVTLTIKEVRLARRSAGAAPGRARDDEAERMLAVTPGGGHVVALCETGRAWTTPQLAQRMEHWMREGLTPCCMIGGPDGLGRACLETARERWSLSPLTLPHGLARVVAVEALYRAWSLLQGHPYHRA